MSSLGLAMAADDVLLRAWLDMLVEEYESAEASWPGAPAPQRHLPVVPAALAGAAALVVAGVAGLAQATASLREGLLSQDPAVLRPLVDWARFRDQVAAPQEVAEGEDARLYLRQLAHVVADGLATAGGTADYLARITATEDRPAALPRRTNQGWEIVLGAHADEPAALVVADLPPPPQWLAGLRALNLRVVHPLREP